MYSMLKTSKINIYKVLFTVDDDNDWVETVPDPQNRQQEQKPFLVVSCIFNLCVHSTVYSV